MLAVAGTQAAIQALPRLRAVARVVVAAPSYAEHAHQWRCAGHAVSDVAYAELEAAIDQADVVVLCNPNNPTGASVAPAQLLAWAARLAQRGGWLVALSRWMPVLPEAVACLAGLSNMRWRVFLPALACGSVPTGFVFAGIGHLGQSEPAWAFALSAIVPILLWLGAVRVLKRDSPGE